MHQDRATNARPDHALDLPESWARDRERRAQAGVPEEVAFTTKPKLGHLMLARASAAGTPCARVTGDSVSGADHALRRLIEAGGRGYVLAVTGARRLGFGPVAGWLEDVPARAWRRLSAGDGAKGPRLYAWAWLPYRAETAPGGTQGLLVRRKRAQPDELTFHPTHAPEAAALVDLVRVAGTRWTVEACFEEATGEVGLDPYEVRGWTGWHRQITLAPLAHAYLAVVRAVAVGGRGPARLGRGAAAAHRARGAAAALAAGLGARARSRTGRRLVDVAPAAPATRPPLPLAPTDPR